MRATGSSRLSTRYCLSADSTRPERSFSELAQIVVVERRHGRPPREHAGDLRRDLVERQHGRAHAGMRDRARHAPDHAGRLVLRDDAAAGGDDRRPRRAVPSVPMPVRITARFRVPQTAAAEANSGSTAGLQKLTSGPSSSAITGVAVAARDPHVAAAGREIDAARRGPARRRPPRAPAGRSRASDARPGWS